MFAPDTQGGLEKSAWWRKSWSPVTGCTPVSAGCKNCWAARQVQRFGKQIHGTVEDPTNYCGAEPLTPLPFSRIVLHPDRLDQPLSWPRPQRVAVCLMGDLFHEQVPDEFLVAVFTKFLAAPQHQYFLLTKRPERMRSFMEEFLAICAEAGGKKSQELHPENSPPDWFIKAHGPVAIVSKAFKHVWLGVSCEDQETANQRIPLLAKTPAAHRFVSLEPLLGPVDLQRWLCIRRSTGLSEWVPDGKRNLFDWVIVGGESGTKARPCSVKWIRGIKDQCQAARVPVFVKQQGSCPLIHPPNVSWFDGKNFLNDTAKLILKSRSGSDPAEWPEDLRVRELP